MLNNLPAWVKVSLDKLAFNLLKLVICSYSCDAGFGDAVLRLRACEVRQLPLTGLFPFHMSACMPIGF